jgi:cytochrome P450
VEFCSNLVAGTDTTSHLFVMMVYYYIGSPEAQRKLKEEVNSVIKTDEDITYDNIKKLTYLKCFQNEVTRMYGPGNGILLREVT